MAELMIHDVEMKWFLDGLIDLKNPRVTWVEEGTKQFSAEKRRRRDGTSYVYEVKETPIHRCYSDDPDPEMELMDGERPEATYRMVAKRYR